MSGFVTIIAGGRDADHADERVERAADSCGWEISEYVSGDYGNVDKACNRLALRRGKKLTCFPPDWNKLGLSAGPIRNGQMGDYAAAQVPEKGRLILIWDGLSKGSRSMLKEARLRGLVCYICPTTDKAPYWINLPMVPA